VYCTGRLATEAPSGHGLPRVGIQGGALVCVVVGDVCDASLHSSQLFSLFIIGTIVTMVMFCTSLTLWLYCKQAPAGLCVGIQGGALVCVVVGDVCDP